MPKLQVIVGGQAGSEGKGAVAGYLAAESVKPTCIRVAGPNAGHSVVHPDTDKKYALRQVPVGAVTNPEAVLGIAAGSEIDLDVLAEEIAWLEGDGIPVVERLVIDPSATILEPQHRDTEAVEGLVGRIGSTGKGIGAARAARIMRRAQTAADLPSLPRSYCRFVEPAAPFAIARGRDIQIEGTQGYLLGLHHYYYPQVTSSDCTAIDFLAMARINPWLYRPEELEIWVVFRPYPIRVAGNSGPLPGETTWEELELPAEQTTVTKKTRRVGLWNGVLAREAIAANDRVVDHRPGDDSPIRLALTMADQIDPALAGAIGPKALLESDKYQAFLQQFAYDTGRTPQMVTTSDRTCIRPAGPVSL